MLKKDLYTNNLIENVYQGNDQDKGEKIKSQIEAFFKELSDRRREDPLEGGLQASTIIMPKAFAAKVNENDGFNSHKITEINLLRIIKNEKNFYKEEAIGEYGLIYKEAHEIAQNGIELRILDGKKSIMISIRAINDIKSIFQLNTLKSIIDNLRKLQANRAYIHVNVGLHTPLSTIEFQDIKEKMYNNLLKAIEKEEKKLLNNIEAEK